MKHDKSKKTKNKNHTLIVPIVVALFMGGVLGFAINQGNISTTERSVSSSATEIVHDESSETAVPIERPSVIISSNDTQQNLMYIIEEEKLAHDVYTKMYELYGSKVFNNISNSETRHQSLVANVLETYKIEDPRSSEMGVFVNQDLQKLYNDLVARGSVSLTDAYKVGVTIEEMDIADLQSDIAALAPEQTDIKSTLEILLKGSENHLRAFNRKLG